MKLFKSRIYLLGLSLLLASCGSDDDDANRNTASGGSASLQITWPSFPESAILNTSSDPLGDPVISPTADSFTIAYKGGGCRWDEETKTVDFEGLGDCAISVTASKEGFPEKEQNFIVRVFGEFSKVSWNFFPGSGAVGTQIGPLTSPVASPAADSIEVAHKSGACTWNDGAKVLAFQGTEECIITVTAKKAGYKDRSEDFSVTPDPGTIGITDWGTYGTVINDGVAVSAPVLGRVNPSDVARAYTTTTSQVCSVASDTGAVTGLQVGTCDIALTLSKAEYNNSVHNYSLQVKGVFTSLTWAAFPASAQVGVATSALSAPVSVPAAGNYAITHKSGDCAWDNSGSILSFSDVSACVLTVTAEKSGYNSLSKDFTVTPTPGTIAATAGSYGKAIFMGETAPSPLTGVDPSGTDAAYVSADDNICTVDGNTGAVTGVDEGECQITLTLSKTGYNDKVITYTAPVALTLNDFKGKNLFKGLEIGLSAIPVFVDLDGDSDDDLVVGEQYGTLKYYRRNADDAPTLFTELTGSDNPFNGINVGNYASPTFAYINGDAKLDLVVGSTDGTLKLYLNQSVGNTITFTQAGTNPFGSIDVGDNSIPTFADISGDNKIDLVVGEHDGSLNFYLNESTQGSIVFTAKTGPSDNPFNGIDVGTFSTPTFAYINGDNKLDLVVGESQGTLKYYLNESTQSSIVFTKKTGVDNPFDGFDVGGNSAPTFTDMDGDDKLDMVVGEVYGTLKYYLNESTGPTIIFTDKTESSNPFNSFFVTDFAKPALADIDADGDMDLALGEGNGGYFKYYLNESSVFTQQTGGDNPFSAINVGFSQAAAPVFVDITGDGKLDLVLGRGSGALHYYLNESTQSEIIFNEKTNEDNPFHTIDVGRSSTPTFADISGDGKLDLVVGEFDGNLNYFLNESTSGTISFSEQTNENNPFNDIDVGDNSIPTFADISGDGKLDLVVGERDGTLNYYLNESTNDTISFTKQENEDSPFTGIDIGYQSAPTFSDINEDNNLDLIIGSQSGKVFTVLNYYGTWLYFP